MSYDTLPEVSKTGKKILTSHPEFGEGTNGSDVAEAFAGNIKGRNGEAGFSYSKKLTDAFLVVITGVSPKSLGETLAVTIARHSPATLILASRTLSKLEAVAKSVRQTSSQVDPKLVVLDLGSLKSVRQAAADISQLVESIDVLINNAAVVSSERRETADGLEQTFGTNHVGHFLFTSLLTPLLLAGAKQAGQAGTTRVVNVTSLGYRLSPIRFHDYNFEGKQVPSEEEPPQGLPAHMKPNLADNRPYQGFCAYGQSKTANILHCVALNQKLGSKGIKAFAVHPGCKLT